jgi:helicase
MRFHGTFIGVDRYQAADIGFLTSAVRDATALHALFADGFEGNPVLLTDAGATRAKIGGCKNNGVTVLSGGWCIDD